MRKPAASDDGDLVAAQEKDDRARNEYGHGEYEKEPAVVLDHYAELGQVAHDRAAHNAQGKDRAYRHGRRDQKKYYGYELNDSRPDAAPRLKPQGREDISGLFGPGEFEKQRLKKNCRDNQL